MRFPDTILPAIKGNALEIDELVIRFRFKRRYRYLWIAISRLTRQVIGFTVGDRNADNSKPHSGFVRNASLSAAGL